MSNGLIPFKPSCIKLMDQHPKFQKIFNVLFDNTQYYTRQQVIDAIDRIITKWKTLRQDRPLYVLLTMNKIGSEHYLYYHFKNMLPPHEIISNPDIKINGGELVMIDDWCLSGNNLASSFEQIMYQIKDQVKDLIFTGIFAIATQSCLSTIRSVLHSSYPTISGKGHVYSDVKVERFDHILKNSGQEFDPQLLNDFMKTFSPDIESFAFPVHLEYKVANQFGSYPTIYLMCREPPDRHFMTEVKTFFNLNK